MTNKVSKSNALKINTSQMHQQKLYQRLVRKQKMVKQCFKAFQLNKTLKKVTKASLEAVCSVDMDCRQSRFITIMDHSIHTQKEKRNTLKGN